LLLFSCKKEEGCMDPIAINYNSQAILDDGSCNYLTIDNLNIHFTQTVDGNSLIIDSLIYTNMANDNYSIQTVRYLISDIILHAENGTNNLIDEIHFIDISKPSSLLLSIDNIDAASYTSISFTVGLDSIKNNTNQFINENFFPSFTWPEFLGGGYHYMQLEGDLNTVFNGYATHTGPTNGVDFSFNKTFPITINATNNIRDIYINMEINNWYQSPQIFNLTTDGIMADSSSQIILQTNGIENVFSINNDYLD
jgi:hypothetical protein